MRNTLMLIALFACISAAPARAWRPLFSARALVNRAAAGGPVANFIIQNYYPNANALLQGGHPGAAKALIWARRHM